MRQNSISQIKYLFFLQFTLLSIVAIIFALIDGWLGLKSALLGGIAWIIPNLYFVWKAHKIKTLFDTKKMLESFFLSGAIKMLLSFIMITSILILLTISEIAFLSGFVSSVFGSLIGSFWQEAKNASH